MWELWNGLAANIFVWRFVEFLAIFWKHLAPNSWFCEMHAPYICICLLTCTYIGFLFLSLLMVWKFVTSNESVIILNARNMVWNTSYKICLQNVQTHYLGRFAKCWKPMRFLVKYKAKEKRAVNDWFPITKLMFWKWCNHFQKFDYFMLSIFWIEFVCSYFLNGNTGKRVFWIAGEYHMHKIVQKSFRSGQLNLVIEWN